jgi:hypothetical protein
MQLSLAFVFFSQLCSYLHVHHREHEPFEAQK